jgi:PhzF family phenazine biosynthesis protein
MCAVRCFQVDAFSNEPFAGNPAAICLLDDERDSHWMHNVAAEMNLSETAFIRPLEEGFELRWFTPAIEVDLCGHATLASAHVLWSEKLVRENEPIQFHTRSGVLTASPRDDLIELDFPSTPADEAEPPEGLLDALDVQPTFVGESKFDKLVVVDSEHVVRSLQPDFRKLGKIGMRGVIVTGLSNDAQIDFVSRFFAPAAGINEDPVTGSAHCCLAPFWSTRLGKNELVGFQASTRGGIVQTRLEGDRVILGGHAVTVLRGELL